MDSKIQTNQVPQAVDFKISIPETEPKVSWNNLDEVNTDDLIESSRALIQTVSQTLESLEISDTGSLLLDSPSQTQVKPNEIQEASKNKKAGSPITGSGDGDYVHNNEIPVTNKPCDDANPKRVPENRLTLPASPYRPGDFLSRSMENLNSSPNSPSSINRNQPSPSILSSGNLSRGNKNFVVPNSCSNPTPVSMEQLKIQRLVPECCIKVWAAEMVMCLENLHRLGLAYG